MFTLWSYMYQRGGAAKIHPAIFVFDTDNKHVARSCSCEDQAVTHRQAHMHTRRLLQPSAYMLGLISQERACTVHVHVILYRQLCTKTKQKPDTTCIQV